MLTTTELISMTGSQARKALEKLPSSELLEIHNKISPNKLKKFRDRESGVDKILVLRKELVRSNGTAPLEKTKVALPAGEMDTTPMPAPVKKSVADHAQKAESTTVTPRKEHDHKTVIRLKKNLNPKKAGTKAFDRYELYMDGMTVADALSAGLTREDIRWDSVHEYIALEATP